MDDWQDAAFTTRHMHNRTGRRNGGKSKHNSAFDVRKTFGSYEVKCPAWQKVLGSMDTSPKEGTAGLELYRLTESGEGVVGELNLPGVLRASVILAGSRESLRRAVPDLEHSDDNEEDDDDDDGNDDNEEEEQGCEIDEPDPELARFQTFEKNSFRSPKFWFRWCGVPTSSTAQEISLAGGFDSADTDLGYIVFTGNDCRKFKGTINCALLKWKNVALTGHKLVSRSESDVAVAWGRSGVVL